VDRIGAPLNRYVAPVLLTADLIDYWVRRQVIEFLIAQDTKGRRDAKEPVPVALESGLSAV
jgi:hypothetical protein